MSLWDNNREPVNGDMVMVAREARGLSQSDLAEALGVKQSYISMMEIGKRPVPDDLLQNIARVLHYPPQFFRWEGRVGGISLQEVFHRKRKSVPKSVLNRIYAQIEIRRRQVTHLLRSVDISSDTDIPSMEVEEYRGGPEEIAGAVRAYWRLPRGPVQNLVATLEDMGIIVIAFDFGTPKVMAIGRFIPGLPPLMFINSRSPTDQWRFSLAHELGHLVMHTRPNPDMEEQADVFAAEFLMPEREIRHDLQRLNLAQLGILKSYWRVSMAALLHRAEELGTVTANQARYLWAQMSQAGYKTREPAEFDIEEEEPELLHELIEVHQHQLGYGIDDLGDILGLYEDELRQIYLEDDARPRLHLVRS